MCRPCLPMIQPATCPKLREHRKPKGLLEPIRRAYQGLLGLLRVYWCLLASTCSFRGGSFHRAQDYRSHKAPAPNKDQRRLSWVYGRVYNRAQRNRNHDVTTCHPSPTRPLRRHLTCKHQHHVWNSRLRSLRSDNLHGCMYISCNHHKYARIISHHSLKKTWLQSPKSPNH